MPSDIYTKNSELLEGAQPGDRGRWVPQLEE